MKKNYIILTVLIVVTVVLTLTLAGIYKNKTREVSSFYNYSNKLSIKELKQYSIENPDMIVYISNKYNLDNSSFEEKFAKKLDSLNLKNKLLFIDKNSINSKDLKEFNKEYNVDLDLSKTPVVIFIVDNKVYKIIYIDESSDANNLIDYGVYR